MKKVNYSCDSCGKNIGGDGTNDYSTYGLSMELAVSDLYDNRQYVIERHYCKDCAESVIKDFKTDRNK